jgi:hypothetical protein
MAKRIGFIAIGLVLLVVIVAGGFLVGMRHHFHPSAPHLHDPPAASTLEAQRQDIRYFRQLIALDRSFAPTDRRHSTAQQIRVGRYREPEAPPVFDSLQSDRGQNIKDFLSSTESRLRQIQPCNVILDLRYDDGGDFVNTYGFARELPKLIPPAGQIIMLTGPVTFSAGISTAAFVKHAGQGRVVIVGEPVGDRLQFFSEGGWACLPNSQLCVAYETGKHDYQHACTDWDVCFWLNYFFQFRVKSLDPDEVIPLSFKDWRAGVDPVLDHAIALATATTRG